MKLKILKKEKEILVSKLFLSKWTTRFGYKFFLIDTIDKYKSELIQIAFISFLFRFDIVDVEKYLKILFPILFKFDFTVPYL